MSCDYTDVIVPIDYTKSAFKHANRKQFHNWKMVGMVIAHGTVGGIKLGPSGQWQSGAVTGCMVIEEINQNNHLIGRGANYFRAKSDGSGNRSATYGIMGHCNTPGLEYAVPSDINPQTVLARPGPFEIDPPYASTNNFRDNLLPTPWFRGWGVKQDWIQCSIINAVGPYRMGFFVRNNETSGVFMYAFPDDECIAPRGTCGKDDQPCIRQCRQRNAQKPGRFSPWVYVAGKAGGFEPYIYRNCEAVAYDLDILGHGVDQLQGRGNSKCYIAAGPAFTYNDILGRSGYPPLEYAVGGGAHLGVIVKLTSLPTCNHFDRVFTIADRRPNKLRDPVWCVATEDDDFTGERIQPDPITLECPENTRGVFPRNLRCERAALRVSSTCQMAWLNGGKYETSLQNFDVVEKHYDRWDKADDGNYKLFDEIIELPDSKLTIRVLAAPDSVWQGYQYPQGWKYDADGNVVPTDKNEDAIFRHTLVGDPSVTYRSEDWFKKKFLTGGNISGVNYLPSDNRGCSCTNSKDGDEGYYPIKPYTEFVYCPNNFSCKKECTQDSMEIK
jgi:hypothetical protein